MLDTCPKCTKFVPDKASFCPSCGHALGTDKVIVKKIEAGPRQRWTVPLIIVVALALFTWYAFAILSLQPSADRYPQPAVPAQPTPQQLAEQDAAGKKTAEINDLKAELETASDNLEKMKNGLVVNTVFVKRQFDVDADTGLAEFESYAAGFGSIVILADPDKYSLTGKILNLRLVKLRRSQFAFTNTNTLTGAQFTTQEFEDVYQLCMPDDLKALETKKADLQQKLVSAESANSSP